MSLDRLSFVDLVMSASLERVADKTHEQQKQQGIFFSDQLQSTGVIARTRCSWAAFILRLETQKFGGCLWSARVGLQCQDDDTTGDQE